MKIDSAYGHFRWGFTRGITFGIRLGILLERHPLRPAKTPVRWPVGGSAGVPDSLGHKPVNTSGDWWPAACRVGSPVVPVFLFRSFFFNFFLLNVFQSLSFHFP